MIVFYFFDTILITFIIFKNRIELFFIIIKLISFSGIFIKRTTLLLQIKLLMIDNKLAFDTF